MHAAFRLLASVAVAACSTQVHAQSMALQDSSIAGFNKTITVGAVPVTAGTKILFKDLTIQLNVDAAGNVTYVGTKPAQALTLAVTPSPIKAGVYNQVGAGATTQIQVNGPQALPSGGGVDEWTTTFAGGAHGSPSPAIFYTGPVANYPADILNRIKQDGISTKKYIGFGVTLSSTSSCTSPCFYWSQEGTLFGVFIVGKQLVFDSFYYDGANPDSELSYIHI